MPKIVIGSISGQEFQSSSSKPIIDEIDRVLAAHYGFTDEELEFIPSIQLRAGINYDIITGFCRIEFCGLA